MRTIKKYILIVTILCLAIGKANAQKDERVKYEFGINGFYGQSGIGGTINNGSIGLGMGYLVLADGKYYFNSHFGFGIGVGYANYLSKANLNDYVSNTPAIDDEGENFEYRVTASGIKEDLNFKAVEIPLFMTFRILVPHKIGFQINTGMKASFPIEATYECTDGAIETKGYYASNNVEFANMPNHGFQTIDKISYSGNLPTTIAYSVFGNAGITIPMGMIGLNLGVYGSYSLNSILKHQGTTLIEYSGNYNSISSLSGKVSLVSGGIRIGLFFPYRTPKIKASRTKTAHGGK